MILEMSSLANQDLALIVYQGRVEYGDIQAEKYLDQIIDTFQSILTFPKLGRVLENTGLHYRIFKINRHLIIYIDDISDNKLKIVRILHEKSDLLAYL